ncbi:hypothetical protein Tco_0866394 [Tanacetum coccineum]
MEECSAILIFRGDKELRSYKPKVDEQGVRTVEGKEYGSILGGDCYQEISERADYNAVKNDNMKCRPTEAAPRGGRTGGRTGRGGRRTRESMGMCMVDDDGKISKLA